MNVSIIIYFTFLLLKYMFVHSHTIHVYAPGTFLDMTLNPFLVKEVTADI